MLTGLQVPFKKCLVCAGEFKINTLICGEGPPLVLFHGLGGSVGFWISNLHVFSKFFTCYAIDLPGFGRSSRIQKKLKSEEEAENYFLEPIHGNFSSSLKF